MATGILIGAVIGLLIVIVVAVVTFPGAPVRMRAPAVQRKAHRSTDH